jgi:acyl carrier protein
MIEADVYSGLTEILQDIFMDDDIRATPALTALDVAGWDSMKQIEIIIAAEERFGVKFTGKEIDGLRRVGDFADLLVSKTA